MFHILTFKVTIVYQPIATIFGYPAKINGGSMRPTLNAEETLSTITTNPGHLIDYPENNKSINSDSLGQVLQWLLPSLLDSQNPFIDSYNIIPYKSSVDEWVFVNCWATKRFGQQNPKSIKIGDIGM